MGRKSGPGAMIDELNKQGGRDRCSNRQELDLNASINVNIAVMAWFQHPKAVHETINVFPNHYGASF